MSETYITCPCGQYLPILDTAYFIRCYSCNRRLSRRDELSTKGDTADTLDMSYT